jgi:hypothetical protein
MIFYLLLLIIICCQNIDQVNTLRCAHACAFGPISFGSADPIKTPCNTVDINTTTTVCSVLLNINFQTSFIRGSLNEQTRVESKSSILHLSSTLFPHSIITSINYHCSTTDDCDQDFVRETVSTSKWSQLNGTKVRTDVTSLLFQTDSSIDNLICANNVICSWNENCYAQRFQNSSVSQMNQIDFNNTFLCDTALSPQVSFEQNFKSPDDNRDETMKIYCNKNGCNEQKPVEQVHNIFRNDFILPLNYSVYTHQPNGSHRVNDFISIRVLLIFICIYLMDILS